mgnify:CR=1 FL=1
MVCFGCWCREEPAPGEVDCFGDADAGSGRDPLWVDWCRGWCKAERGVLAAEICAIEIGSDTKGNCQFCRTVCKVPIFYPVAPSSPYNVDSVDWFDATEQDTLTKSLVAGNDVCAVVHPVAEIDVEVTSVAEHRCIPSGLATVAVRSWLILSIGLDLDDPSAREITIEAGRDNRAEQPWRKGNSIEREVELFRLMVSF